MLFGNDMIHDVAKAGKALRQHAVFATGVGASPNFLFQPLADARSHAAGL
jgi:hypothetical protein